MISVMIGLPGSGKSTIARAFEKAGYKIFSSDKTRGELYGDESIQGNPREVFDKLYKDIEDCLRRDKNINIVFDATNINRKDRKQICDIARRRNIWIEALIMRTPLEICLERNSKRERVVPREAIERMVGRFEYPLYSEGFNKISAIDCFDKDKGFIIDYPDMQAYLDKCVGFDQQNIHHTADLYNHMINTRNWTLDHDGIFRFSLRNAALYHDVGKLYTQTGPDENGNCHYFGHANWSAYIYFTSRQFDTLSCRLINYHMIPYLNEWEKFKKKNAQEKNKFLMLLEILHDADLNAH